MSLLDLYPEHLRTLLQTMPALGKPLIGYQLSGPVMREYGSAMKKFISAFAMAGGSYFERKPLEGFYMPPLAMHEQASGFYSVCADMNPNDQEDMLEAVTNARREEKLACEEAVRLIQDSEFAWQIRVAQGNTRLSMCSRGLNDNVDSRMKESVWMPERNGRGLPELMRKVTALGGLATAVWLATAGGKMVGETWCETLLAHPEGKYETHLVKKARLEFKMQTLERRHNNKLDYYYEHVRGIASKSERARIEREITWMKKIFEREREDLLREIDAMPDGE